MSTCRVWLNDPPKMVHRSTNTKTKHNKDGKYGFYKYKTWFAVKDKNGKYIEYFATLVIRRDANTKSYLYDITEIKKVGALKLASTSQGSHGHVGGNPPQSNPTTNRIPQTTQNATKKSLKVELTEDSLGRKLSETQMEYFKDSKVRDENGALKPVYHGTKNDFSIFDSSKGEKKRLNMLGEGKLNDPPKMVHRST